MAVEKFEWRPMDGIIPGGTPDRVSAHSVESMHS